METERKLRNKKLTIYNVIIRRNDEVGAVQPPHPYEDHDEVASLEEEVATLSDCAGQISVEIDSLRDELRQVRKHGERVEALYKKLQKL